MRTIEKLAPEIVSKLRKVGHYGDGDK